MSLSDAAQGNIKSETPLLMLGWKRWFLNQNTIINLSTAENRLCSPTGLLQYPDLEHILYGTATGSIELKSLVAELINDYFSILKRPLKSNQVIVFAGAAACLGALSRVLCNPGDIIILSCPYYGGFDWDCKNNSQAQLVPIPSSSSEEFLPSLTTLTRIYNECVEKGGTVKVLLLSSPNNPTGQTIPLERLKAYYRFCKERNIHVVSDEVYGICSRGNIKTISGSNVQMDGTLEPFHSGLCDEMEDLEMDHLVHVIWSFSKDLNMSGMRAATIMSRNPSVIAALRAVSPFHNINVITDAILTKFLSDSTQLKKFILDNVTSINENYSRLSQFLLDNNIPFKRANSGFFVFADLGMFLGNEKTLDREIMLYEKILDGGVYIAPGSAFKCTEAGWFRILYGNTWETVELALNRILRVCKEFSRSS